MSNWKYAAAALLSEGFAPVKRCVGANDRQRPTSGKDRSKALAARFRNVAAAIRKRGEG